MYEIYICKQYASDTYIVRERCRMRALRLWIHRHRVDHASNMNEAIRHTEEDPLA